MKRIVQVLAVAILLGSSGLASAAGTPAHHHHRHADYSALSLKARRAIPDAGDPAPAAQSDDESHDTATGGPAGGIN